MIFSTIEDETSAFGIRITSIFKGLKQNIISIFDKNTTISFGSGFTDSIQNDTSALMNYINAINNGKSADEAFAATMREASIDAQNYANSLNAVERNAEEASNVIAGFVNKQNMSAVSTLAQNKSLSNCSALINEYNSGMATCGLSQDQFIESINQSNSSLGKYLSNVDVGKASIFGYTVNLVGAKLATIGLRVATTALNAVIGMGIGLIVSLISSGIVQLIESIKEEMKPLSEKLDDVNSKLKETQTAINTISDNFQKLKQSANEVIPRFVELAKGVNSFGENVTLTDEEYAEFLTLNNKIAEMFPELNMGMDDNGNAMLALSYSANTLTDSLNALVEAQRQAANEELADKLPDLVDDTKAKRELLNKEIDGYKSEIKNYQEWMKDLSSGKVTTDWYSQTQDEYGNSDLINYDKMLKQAGVKYHIETESREGTGNGFLDFFEIATGNLDWQRRYTFVLDDSQAAFERAMDDYIAGINNKIENIKQQINKSWQSMSPSLQAWLKTNSTFDSFSENLQKVASTMLKNVDWADLGLETDEEITGYIERNILEPLQQADLKTQTAFDQLVEIEPNQFNSVSDYMDAIKQKINEIANMSETDGLDYDSIFEGLGYDEIFKKYDEAINGIKGLLPEVSEGMIKSLSPSEVIDAFNDIKTYGIQSWEDLQTFVNAKKITGAFSEEEVSKLKDTIDEIKNSLSDLKSAYDNVSDIIEEYNENGYYTLDNLKSLLELKPEYLNTLINEKGQIDLNSQAYKDYVAAKAKTLVIDQIKSLYNTILSMSAEEAQAYANAEAYNTETDSLEDLISATTSYYLVLARAKDAQNNTTAYTDGLKQSFKTVANYAAIYDSWLNSLNSSTNEFTNKTNGATSALEAQKSALESEKSALEDYKDGLEDAKDALEDYKDSLEDAQGDIQSLIDLTIDYIKQTKENEKSAIQDSIDALEDKKSALDDQKDAYSKLISKRKEEIEALYEEKKAQDELSEKQKSAAKDALSLAIAQLDDSSAGKKAQKQAKDNYDSSQKDFKDYLDEQAKDKRIAALEEDEKANEEMIERRKAAIDAQVEHLESKIDEIDAYLDNSRKLYEDACRMIDNDNGTLYSNLWNYTYTYTTKTRAEFDYLWSSAQAAIQRYKGDNDTLISTMEILQGKIYDTDRQIENLNGQIDDCETQISNLDSAISSTSNAINSTSGAIDNVSSSLGGLSSNIERYKKALDELTKANNNGGDIPSNAKWTFDYTDKNGDIRTAWSTSKDFETAVRDIQSIIEKETGYYRPDVFGGIKKRYASGTRNSSGGVSITQEDGFEAIFGKLSSGQYTMMPQGSQVFTAAQTDNLYGFASNPQKFISDVIGKMSSFLSSSYGNFADSVRGVTNKVTKYGGDMTFSSAPVYHIYGKVDNDTLNKMDKQEKQRYELFKKQFMLEMLREKNNL